MEYSRRVVTLLMNKRYYRVIFIFRLVVLSFILLTPFLLFSEEKQPKWLSLTIADSLREETGKPIVINIYRNGCGWCRKMDNITYTDSLITSVIKESYLPVKLNTSSRKKIKFNDVEIDESSFARALGIRGVPSTVFISPDGKPVVNAPGFIPPEKYIYLLKFVTGKWYEEFTFDEYYQTEKQIEERRGN